jgi:hypothetical protein
VRSGAKRLTRKRLGVGNRCFVMLHVEPKRALSRAWVRFGRVRRTRQLRPPSAARPVLGVLRGKLGC